MSWTDEERNQAIAQYEEAEPTAENSIDIVSQIAEDMDKTPNGVRGILIKAGVYVKKTPATAAASSGSSSGGSKRVSKEEAQGALSDAISATGQEPDMDIISKLTGKAAVYLAGVITGSQEN